MLLADGGILNQVPVDAALFLGVHKIVAVDVTVPGPLELPARRRPWQREAEAHLGPIQALRRAAHLMQAQLTDMRLSLYPPDVLLQPSMPEVDLASFRRSAEAIRAGEEAARAELERLRELVS